MWAAGIFFALYLMTEIGITRIRAEVGSPIHDLHFAGPEYLMVGAVGTRKLGTRESVCSIFLLVPHPRPLQRCHAPPA